MNRVSAFCIRLFADAAISALEAAHVVADVLGVPDDKRQRLDSLELRVAILYANAWGRT